MLKRSFAEFHAQRSLPAQKKELERREGALSDLKSTIK
jgi:antiviral helicase SKI2